MFVKIIYSIIFILLGVSILKYRKQIKSISGNFVWAEKFLGRGGTYLVIIFIGLFLIFLGIVYPMGGFNF